jgi:hypothetical protein
MQPAGSSQGGKHGSAATPPPEPPLPALLPAVPPVPPLPLVPPLLAPAFEGRTRDGSLSVHAPASISETDDATKRLVRVLRELNGYHHLR